MLFVSKTYFCKSLNRSLLKRGMREARVKFIQARVKAWDLAYMGYLPSLRPKWESEDCPDPRQTEGSTFSLVTQCGSRPYSKGVTT
jgi:hypothetical protein